MFCKIKFPTHYTRYSINRVLINRGFYFYEKSVHKDCNLILGDDEILASVLEEGEKENEKKFVVNNFHAEGFAALEGRAECNVVWFDGF